MTLIGATLRLIMSSSSSRSLSTSAPLGPITRPGRAVLMVIVTSSRVRSMMISETAANGGRRFSFASISLRTLKSSPRKSPYAALGAYQRLFQSSVMPVRKPVGFTFWPMLLRSFVQTDDEVARPLHDVVRLAAILRLETLDRRTRIGPG